MNKNSKGLATFSLHERGFVHLFLLFVIVLIGIGGLLYYSWQKGLIKTTPTSSRSPIPTSRKDEAEDWKTYFSNVWKYTFKYPSNWHLAPVNIDEDYAGAQVLLNYDDQELNKYRDGNGFLDLDKVKNPLVSIHIIPGNLIFPIRQDRLTESGTLADVTINNFNEYILYLEHEYPKFDQQGIGSPTLVPNPEFDFGAIKTIQYVFEKSDADYDISFYVFPTKEKSIYLNITANNLKGVSFFEAPESNIVHQILSTFKFTGSESSERKFCGGFAGIACPEGYTCKLDGNYPDSGGTCIKE
ncbi:hypothetical protein A2715_01070 [Candidatus Woesebacteria bacterium RIFCSPHIGHO2_01_FULL_39_32]|uniref:Uncharacterized protein n=1 Tax=Candidatus Woesebacteria bacterium RIFCSPLOWO2_01_FULL_39_25 TaxID=1802521 RepID=A0A1F8BIB6_9BACT|nr:MAG: hypothetical protein A2715_01070 [Candidatus Woesebacteria bacterium RIFCSPHIGHO2_01_FULL_39_32]OGM63804.1 MAG: hypothetical protein A2893_02405 [Candidatus Woesebacteria bacterium RIFCSPLOWO2_01_FULL_39_25]